MDLGGLSDEVLGQLGRDVEAEQRRRYTLRTAEQVAVEANLSWLEAAGREPGGEWVAPTGYHDAYPHDWQVTHDGLLWTSTRDGASGVPGQSPDWRQVAGEGEVLDWVQPHAGSEYPVGVVVRHAGRLWRNDYTYPNGWEPGTTGSQWTDLGRIEN